MNGFIDILILLAVLYGLIRVGRFFENKRRLAQARRHPERFIEGDD